MSKKLALVFLAAIAAISLLVPFTAGARPAARATCVEINGPGHFHLQIGYAPKGPDSCKKLP